jgi:hypothetical protein
MYKNFKQKYLIKFQIMKRKSILLTIVALLFAGLASAQNSWIDPNVSSTVPTDIKGSDTIYFCATTDSLYPIELGYDVAGKRLHPSYGDWSLYAVSQPGLSVRDYKIDAAGNVYNVVGSGIGGYIFKYLAKDVQCGLQQNEAFYVYVFVMPDLANVITEDTLICYNTTPPGQTFPVTPQNSFNYTDLYNKAGITFAWRHPSTTNIRIDSIGTYVFIDTFDISVKPAKYNCKDEGIYRLTVHVDSLRNLDPLNVGICASDTLDPALSPWDIFKHWTRHINWPGMGAGQYTPDLVKNGTWFLGTTDTFMVFEYAYRNCFGDPKIVKDTVYLLPDHGAQGYFWGKDTIVQCRPTGLRDLFALYMEPEIDYLSSTAGLPSGPWHKPALGINKAYWYERGKNYDHTSSNPIDLGSVYGGPTMAGSYILNYDNMASSIGYNYLWRPDPSKFPCIASDSGVMVVILNDLLQAADFRVQLCQKFITAGAKFDLAAFTGIKGASWYYGAYPNPVTSLVNDELELSNTTYTYGPGVHKLLYDVSSGCGGGRATLFIKIANNVKIPTNITEKFCVSTLPATINLNEVIGLYDGSASWAATNIGTATAAGFDSVTGIIDVGKFGNAVYDYVFTLSPGSGSCFTSPIVVTLKFVTSIL